MATDSLDDIDRAVQAQIAYQRACRAAAEKAAGLLAVLDAQNKLELDEYEHGAIVRGLEPETETACCALRAALAEVQP
jgi:hypothetical protein